MLVYILLYVVFALLIAGSSSYEGDSAGETALALLIGAAWPAFLAILFAFATAVTLYRAGRRWLGPVFERAVDI